MLYLINKIGISEAQMIYKFAQRDMYTILSTLVEYGWMSAKEMQDRIEFSVAQSLSHALRWVTGGFAFDRHLQHVDVKIHSLDVDNVLLESLRQADEWEEVMQENVTHLARTTVARWQTEMSKLLWGFGPGLSKEKLGPTGCATSFSSSVKWHASILLTLIPP